MNSANIKKFYELLDEIVNDNEFTWREKRAKLASEADKQDEINLGEFIAWFEPAE